MRTADFARGVADRRAGKSPDYDADVFCQDDGDDAAITATNAAWAYERGRQWACLAPLSMPLRVKGKLNRKAIALFKAASMRSFIS